MNYTKIVQNRSFWLWAIFIASCAFLGTFLIWLMLVSLNNGTHMDTYAANGTFQLYNPLKRLAAGQTAGLDFPFFHGIGIPLLHLPLFNLLGGGVFAAETVKWVISPLAFLASSFVFFYAYFKDLKKSTAAVALFAIMALAWIDVVWPGNSLMGLRGTMPVLVAAALLWQTTRKLQFKNYSIALNEFIALVLLGVSLPFGTEQGVCAILAYAVVKFVVIFKRQPKARLQNTIQLGIKGLFILVIALATYTLLTKGHPIPAITYAFIDVPTDQGWYFGTDVQGFLTWDIFLPQLFRADMKFIWLTIILGSIGFYVLIKRLKKNHLKQPFWYMISYGFMAFILTITGYYYASTQTISLQRMMGLIFIIFIVSAIFSRRTWEWKPSTKRLQYAKIALLIALLLTPLALITFHAYTKISLLHTDYDVRATLHLAKEARHADDYFASSANWKSRIDTFQPYIQPNKTIWSLYTSVYDTNFGQKWNLAKGGEDYVIHALGDKRRDEYNKNFHATKPDYVITLKPHYFAFEEWLWAYHWDIYQDIFTNYTVVSENDSHYLWMRNTQHYQPPASQPAKTTASSISLPKNDTDSPIVYTVRVTYKAHSSLPMTKKIPRYLIAFEDPRIAQKYRISLPSQKTSWSFPVIVMPRNDTVDLTATTAGMLPLSNLTITGATYTKLDITPSNMKPIDNNICAIKHQNLAPAEFRYACKPAFPYE